MSSVELAISDWVVPWEWSEGDIDDIRDWLIALATLGAVLVALFLPWRRERRERAQRPELSLKFDEALGLPIGDFIYSDGAGNVMATGRVQWLRFHVANAPDKQAAEDVEVLVSQVVSIRENQRVNPVIDISFPALGWTHASTTRLTIAPGVVRAVDVGRMHLKEPPPEFRDVFELSIEPVPADGRHRLTRGTYDILFTLSARNANAKNFRIRIVYDPDDRPRLVVQVPPTEGPPASAYRVA